MPRRLFTRLLVQSALALLVLLLAAGMALDRFLARSEIERFEGQLARYAALLAENVSREPPGAPLQPLVQRLGHAAGVRFTVVDRRGTVLADSDRDPATMENHAGHAEVAVALSGSLGREVRRSATLGIEMMYVALPGNPVARAALPMAEVRAVLAQVRHRIAVASLPAALVAFGLAFLLARSLTRRIEAMIRFSSAVAAGDFAGGLRPWGDDELSDMERGLLSLRDEIRDRMATLDRERATLASLVEGFPHAVVVLDGDGRAALTNALARALLRLADRDARGLPAAEVLRQPRVLDGLDALARGESPEPFLVEWIEPSGWVEVLLRPLPDERGRPGSLAVLRDVTRQVHLERVRTDFVANLSHELRTPLTAIRGSAETLLDGALADEAAARRFLDTIRRNSLRLEALLKDVSDLARVESGAEGLTIDDADGRHIASQVADLFAAEAQRAGVTLEPRLAGEPLPVVSDAAKVESILINLVQNAIRYTPAGGRVVLSAEGGEGGVVFRVEDTGVGIPSRDLPRVTERFYRVDPGRSRAAGGTGLGLAIVKHLTELLGGTLDIRSESGRGTRVEVFVPDRGAAG